MIPKFIARANPISMFAQVNRHIFLPLVLRGVEEASVLTGMQTREQARRDTEQVLNSSVVKWYDKFEEDILNIVEGIYGVAEDILINDRGRPEDKVEVPKGKPQFKPPPPDEEAQPQPSFERAEGLPEPFNPIQTNVNTNLQKALQQITE